MRFGTVDRFVLFGGGRPLVAFSRLLQERGLEFSVFTSPRQLDDDVDDAGTSLSQALGVIGVEFFVSENIARDERLDGLIGPETIGMSFDAAWIFRQRFINRFNGKLFNSHGMRLPQYRGGGGYSWQIMRRFRMGYSLLHFVDAGIDTGDVLQVHEFQFPASCSTPEEFYEHLRGEDEKLFAEFLERITTDYDWSPAAQPEYLSSYFPRLNTMEHGWIDWRWSSRDIESFAQAFENPYPGASTLVDGHRVFLKQVMVEPDDGRFHPFMAGLIYRTDPSSICVATRDVGIRIGEVLDENGDSVMPRLKQGARLFTPREHLDAARSHRAVYGPSGVIPSA